MYNEDYLHAIGEKFRPKPDNLKLMLVAGAAFFSAIILSLLLTFFYWNGSWHIKTPTGENLPHGDSHAKDEAETQKEATTEKPSDSH